MKIRLPGTRVSIEPPRGFEPVPGLAALRAREQDAFLVVTELPYPSELDPQAWEHAAATGGMRVRSAESVHLRALEGSLVISDLELSGRAMRRWQLVLGDAEASLQAHGSCPAAWASELDEPLRQALLGIEWARDELLEPYAGLPFTLDPGACGAPLVFTGRVNAAPCFREAGASTEEGARRDMEPPLLIASAHPPWSALTRLRTYAEWQLGQARRLVDVELESSRPFSIRLGRLRRLRGWEVTAGARDAREDRPVLLWRAVVRLRGTIATLNGSARPQARERWIPAFQALARSLRPKTR